VNAKTRAIPGVATGETKAGDEPDRAQAEPCLTIPPLFDDADRLPFRHG
jgi:hypothetical protein